jgi:MFS family permease
MQGAGPALGSVFGGLVVDATNSWRWTMWLSAIPSGVCLLLVIFLIPETNFRRSVEATKVGMTSTNFAELRRTLQLSNRKALGVTGWYDRYAFHGSNISKDPFTNRSRETSLWTFFIRPIVLLPLPAVLYASLTYGVTLGWCVIQATANATAFPTLYNSSAIGVGNINIGVRYPQYALEWLSCS